LNTSRPRFDPLEIAFPIEQDRRSVQQRLIRARPERIAGGDGNTRSEKTGDAGSEPADQHPGDLQQRAEHETHTVTEPIGQPAGRHLERRQRQVTGRENQRN
jgi:hypothetical protein